jgi:asparagine synthase (glutamine-hydrolysing)
VPFLTPALVNFIFSLPEEHMIDVNGTTKAVFRRAMHDIVPVSVLQRQDKLGFSTPERQWLNDLSPWVEATLNSQIVDSIPALNRIKISEEWREVLTGRKPFNFRIWRWINLIRWVERYQIEF